VEERGGGSAVEDGRSFGRTRRGGFSKISCFPVLFSVGRFWLNGGKI